MSARPGRQEQRPAFVLHTYPYRETSLLVEAFTRDFGRVALLARGARRPRSEVRGTLLAFQPLLLSWSGNGEVKTLTKSEWQGGIALPPRSALMSAFYLNDLLLRFLPREDAHVELYDHYEKAVQAFSAPENTTTQAALLRRFELSLLAELGYAMPLAYEYAQAEQKPSQKQPVNPQKLYHYIFETGPCPADRDAFPDAPVVRGATLLALTEGNYPDAETVIEAQRLMAFALEHFLENRRLPSRYIAQELRRFRRLSRPAFDEKEKHE